MLKRLNVSNQPPFAALKITLLLLLQPWNDFMNCSGEEQERLLSLLEEEGARKKSASRLPKDGRNGDLCWLALAFVL